MCHKKGYSIVANIPHMFRNTNNGRTVRVHCSPPFYMYVHTCTYMTMYTHTPCVLLYLCMHLYGTGVHHKSDTLYIAYLYGPTCTCCLSNMTKSLQIRDYSYP